MNDKIFFDDTKMPKATNKYVAWVDVMGTRSIMKFSAARARMFLFKFHATIAEIDVQEDLTLVPLMDGVYVVTSTQQKLKDIVNRIFNQLSKELMSTKKLEYGFQ